MSPWPRLPLAFVAAASCLTCRDTSVAPPPPSDRLVAVAVVPPVVTIGPGGTQAFRADRVTAGGDTLPGAMVEWHATGGTITAEGVFTAASDSGTFSVTAVSLDAPALPGRARVRVTRAVVARVAVRPDTASVPIQGSWPFHATLFDANGDSIPVAQIAWTSSDTQVATVDAGGLVTGVAPGTATITAASLGRTGSALVTVVPPGSGPWPNEPAGFRVISDQPWNLLTSLGWFVQFGVGAIGLDSTARLSPPNVLQFTYPVGFAGGEAPGTLALELGGVRQVYGGIWWKVSNPWQGHDTNVNKIQYVFTSSHGSMACSWRCTATRGVPMSSGCSPSSLTMPVSGSSPT